jgi:hypothetical protein
MIFFFFLVLLDRPTFWLSIQNPFYVISQFFCSSFQSLKWASENCGSHRWLPSLYIVFINSLSKPCASEVSDLLLNKVIDWVDWLIIYCFTSRSWIFHWYGVTGEGMQNLGLFSALRVFEQGGVFIVCHVHLLWHGTSVFPVSSEGPPRTTHKGMLFKTYSNPDPQSPLTKRKGMLRTYHSSNPDPHGKPTNRFKHVITR